MSAFDSVLAADAVAIIGAEFSESAVYSPASPTPTNQRRTINVIVERHTPAPLKSQENWTPPKMRVSVANHPSLGITSAQIDTGGDTLTLAYRVGEAVRDFRIGFPATGEFCDAGMLILELR